MSIIEKALSKLATERGGRKTEEDGISAQLVDVGSGERAPAPGAPVEPDAAATLSPAEALPSDTEKIAEGNFVSVGELELDGFIPLDGGRSRMGDSFRVIKRPILINAFEGGADSSKPRNLVMVSSSIASEGKTFISLNMAISVAQELDRTILLVDADVAKPGLSRLLQVQDRLGLLDLLSDPNCRLSDVILATEMPKLSIIPAGSRHTHSTELLASNAMKSLLSELAHRYPDRLVLFDSPPILATTEASVLAREMGQIIMVVEAEGTARSLVREALQELGSTDNVALVLNKCRPMGIKGYPGYYYYYYGGYYDRYGE
jgi:protein-tyrosine kinase